MKLSEEILAELLEIMQYRESLPLEGMALKVISKHIGPIEELLKDVPGDTSEQKIRRVFHELEDAHRQITQLEAENERLAGLQNRIFTWARQTFGAEQRQDGIFAHLTREIKELGKSIPESDPDELADCTILLFELAGYAEVDLLDEVEKKFAINQQRKWGPMQEDGSILHIEHLDVEAPGGD